MLCVHDRMHPSAIVTLAGYAAHGTCLQRAEVLTNAKNLHLFQKALPILYFPQHYHRHTICAKNAAG